MTHEDRVDRWRRLIVDQAASGVSIVAWCAQHGILRKDFYRWRTRFATEAEAPPQWMPLTAVDAPALPDMPAASALPSGITLQVGAVTIAVAPDFQPAVLRAVLATLEAVC